MTINNIKIKTNYPKADPDFTLSVKKNLEKGMTAGSFKGYWWIITKNH